MRSFMRAVLRIWRKEREEPASILWRTERLALRELRKADWPAVYAFLSDPEVVRYLARSGPYTEAEVKQELHDTWQVMRQPSERWCNYAIVLTAEDLLIGECGLYGTDPEEALLSFVLHRSYWGNGYATEAAQAMLRHAFADLRLERVAAGCLPENIASRRVLEKLRMREEGMREDFPGSPPDTLSLVFSISRSDWYAAIQQEDP